MVALIIKATFFFNKRYSLIKKCVDISYFCHKIRKMRKITHYILYILITYYLYSPFEYPMQRKRQGENTASGTGSC